MYNDDIFVGLRFLVSSRTKSFFMIKILTRIAHFFNIWPVGSNQVETDNLIDLQGEEEPQEEAEPQEGAEPQEEEAEPQEEGAEGEEAPETAEEPPADGDEMGNGEGE
jgi:hypothetical protein